jgi:hyperosmotically inducible periplasmic protein
MNTRQVTSCIVTAALLLPVAGYTADYDTDRSSPKAFVKDAAITTKIKSKLAAEKLASAMHIKVDTDKNGVVTLSGKATSQGEADKAVSIARSVEGVAAVENNIQVVAHR